MRNYTVRTKLVLLLGNPLGHTLSPAMHNRLFEKLDLDYLYLPVEVSAEDLETVFSGLKKMNVAGFNVTIPHKIAIMDKLDSNPSALAGAELDWLSSGLLSHWLWVQIPPLLLRDSSSIGRAPACHAGDYGFDPRESLGSVAQGIVWRPPKPLMLVQLQPGSPWVSSSRDRALVS